MPTTINPFQNVSNTTYSGNGLGASPAYVISNKSVGATWTTTSSDTSGIIELTGHNADILINGVSLKEILENIESRLNILRPNAELEAEWDELKELGELYRKKEAEFKEKQKMWSILKK